MQQRQQEMQQRQQEMQQQQQEMLQRFSSMKLTQAPQPAQQQFASAPQPAQLQYASAPIPRQFEQPQQTSSGGQEVLDIVAEEQKMLEVRQRRDALRASQQSQRWNQDQEFRAQPSVPSVPVNQNSKWSIHSCHTGTQLIQYRAPALAGASTRRPDCH